MPGRYDRCHMALRQHTSSRCRFPGSRAVRIAQRSPSTRTSTRSADPSSIVPSDMAPFDRRPEYPKMVPVFCWAYDGGHRRGPALAGCWSYMNRPVTPSVDFNRAPFLVIWEVTRACALACVHCRADAIHRRDPRELTTEEGFRLIDQVRARSRGDWRTSRRSPLFVLTGGDPMRRPDLAELVRYAIGGGIDGRAHAERHGGRDTRTPGGAEGGGTVARRGQPGRSRPRDSRRVSTRARLLRLDDAHHRRGDRARPAAANQQHDQPDDAAEPRSDGCASRASSR